MARTHVLPNCYEPLGCISLQNIYLRYYTKEWLNWSKAFVYCVSKPKKNWSLSYKILRLHYLSVYRPNNLLGMLGEHSKTLQITRLCLTEFSSVLPTSQVGPSKEGLLSASRLAIITLLDLVLSKLSTCISMFQNYNYIHRRLWYFKVIVKWVKIWVSWLQAYLILPS